MGTYDQWKSRLPDEGLESGYPNPEDDDMTLHKPTSSQYLKVLDELLADVTAAYSRAVDDKDSVKLNRLARERHALTYAIRFIRGSDARAGIYE
jgi:hypothetical protein